MGKHPRDLLDGSVSNGGQAMMVKDILDQRPTTPISTKENSLRNIQAVMVKQIRNTIKPIRGDTIR